MEENGGRLYGLRRGGRGLLEDGEKSVYGKLL